jgi:hypothetical protein
MTERSEGIDSTVSYSPRSGELIGATRGQSGLTWGETWTVHQ